MLINTFPLPSKPGRLERAGECILLNILAFDLSRLFLLLDLAVTLC